MSGVSRRGFVSAVVVGGGSSLVLGFSLAGCSKDDRRDRKPLASAKAQPTPAEVVEPIAVPPAPETSALTAWIEVAADDSVTFRIAQAEMGQGALTGLAMVLADELGARWDRVRAEHAPYDPESFGFQLTGGSSSIRGGYESTRRAAAAARDMLVRAAAARWGVAADACDTLDNAVVSRDGARRLGFGALVAAAAALDVPADPPLRDPGAYRYVGKAQPRLDLPAKVTGQALFGIDVDLPDMLVGQPLHPPVWGARLAALDDRAALAVTGVRQVVRLPDGGGAIVVADHTWAASKGRDALAVEWDLGANAALSSESILERCRKVIGSGTVARNDGRAGRTIASAGERAIEAAYEVPFLAHAPMEPLNATAHVREGEVELWVPTQSPTLTATRAAQIAGVDPSKVTVHTTFMGGGFGRRAQTDFVADAVLASKAVGKPVKVVWRREDDIQGWHYRPMAYNELRGAVDKEGWPLAWEHRIASPGVVKWFREQKADIDSTSIEGAANVPYALEHVRVTCVDPGVDLPVFYWRSVGSSQNAYVTECFFDELARLGGKDPVEARRKLLAAKPRHLRVLDAAVQKSGYGKALAPGRAHGVAVHESFGSFCAQVAEVSIENGQPRVHKVTCAIDPGQVVNPDSVVAQMESGIAFGLSAALYGEVPIEGGRAQVSNFHDYRAVRIGDMPRVDTVLVPSGDALGGVGEPGTPPIAPAVCNALYALTGKPVRRLPIRLG